MHPNERDALFRKALAAYRNGNTRDAAAHLQYLLAEGTTDPRHLSYGGLLMATIQGRTREGRKLCERAAEIGFYDPQIFLNLARVYQHVGWKDDAVEALRKGLRLDPDNVGLRQMLKRLNPRRKTPIGSLGRSHFLNKYLGKIRHRWFGATG